MICNYFSILRLTKCKKLWSHSKVLTEPCPVPEKRGIYAWYFEDIPPEVPVDGCNKKDGKTLLYVGVSGDLRRRIARDHFNGTAEGSTLRYSLGVLLPSLEGCPLRLDDKGNKSFKPHGEQLINCWLKENAYVCWLEHKMPKCLEEEMLTRFLIPLNIDDNGHRDFTKILRGKREKARAEAVDEAKKEKEKEDAKNP